MPPTEPKSKKGSQKAPHDDQLKQQQLNRGGGAGRVYGKGATMPVMAADKYAEVVLPELNMFDPLSEDTGLKLDSTIVAVGKRRTGKSWIFRNLLYLLKDQIPAGIVISQTDELNKFWRQYVPKKYIFAKYSPEILDAVFARQKKILNNPELTTKQKDKQAPFFVLLDDVISDPAFQRNEPQIKELFVAGRHYRLLVLITTQYAKAITPTLRGNTDFLFILKTVQQRQREALWEDFADFLTKDAFGQMIDAYTEDNETLVVNTCPDNKIDPMEMMSWWKAVDPGVFRVGSKEYWESAFSGNQGNPPPPNTGNTSYLSSTHLASADSLIPEWAKAMSGT